MASQAWALSCHRTKEAKVWEQKLSYFWVNTLWKGENVNLYKWVPNLDLKKISVRYLPGQLSGSGTWLSH